MSKNNKADVICYVIMPNHLHVILKLQHQDTDLNKIMANGKRFMAYEIVKRLESSNQYDLLD